MNMEFYPNYFEHKLNTDLIPDPQPNRTSYANYIISLIKLWCADNDIVYTNFLASLFSLVLQGKIKIEKKDKRDLLTVVGGLSKADRIIAALSPSEFLYNIYNKHNVPISDYSEIEFLLGYKNYILDKL